MTVVRLHDYVSRALSITYEDTKNVSKNRSKSDETIFWVTFFLLLYLWSFLHVWAFRDFHIPLHACKPIRLSTYAMRHIQYRGSVTTPSAKMTRVSNQCSCNTIANTSRCAYRCKCYWVEWKVKYVPLNCGGQGEEGRCTSKLHSNTVLQFQCAHGYAWAAFIRTVVAPFFPHGRSKHRHVTSRPCARI